MFESDGKTKLSGSADTALFTVSYSIRCFVKHESIFEVG